MTSEATGPRSPMPSTGPVSWIMTSTITRLTKCCFSTGTATPRTARFTAPTASSWPPSIPSATAILSSTASTRDWNAGWLTARSFDRDQSRRVVPGDNIDQITKGQDPQHITAYFTKAFSPEGEPYIAGMAFYLKGFKSPPAPSVFVNSGPKTLAHEFGHVLLETSLHSDERDNLMGYGRGTVLTREQIQTIRTHK